MKQDNLNLTIWNNIIKVKTISLNLCFSSVMRAALHLEHCFVKLVTWKGIFQLCLAPDKIWVH